MDVNILNLTPHTVQIHRESGELAAKIAPQGEVARVDITRIHTGFIEDIPIFATKYGKTELPSRSPDTIYIVSGLVRAAVPDREDVFSPGELIRDEGGRVKGCIGLTR